MFSCVLCDNKFLLFAPLCDECLKIRNLIRIYSKDRIIGILNDKLIVKSSKNSKGTETEKTEKKVEKIKKLKFKNIS